MLFYLPESYMFQGLQYVIYLRSLSYVDEKIGPYLCGDDAEIREIADDVEMFVHARYTVI